MGAYPHLNLHSRPHPHSTLQCLSVAKLPPSERSKYRLDCAVDMGPSPACPKSGTFDPSK